MNDENLNDFANLRTDCAFDNSGDPNARHVTKNELVQLNTSSLLIESLIEQWCNSLDVTEKEQQKLYLKICEKLFQKQLIDDSFRQEKFKFMRNHYQKAFFHVINVAKNTQVDSNQRITGQQLMLMPRRFSLGNLFQCSRYRDDFEEMEFIARGGFGQVYKAKNKLDNGIYAVKKIFLSYADVNAFFRSLHEVQMLAKLNHPNIVSYKAAWLEPVETKTPPETTKVSDDLHLSQDEMSARLKNDNSSVVVFKNSSDSTSMENHSSKRNSDSKDSKKSAYTHSKSSSSNRSNSPVGMYARSPASNDSRGSVSHHSWSTSSNHVEKNTKSSTYTSTHKKSIARASSKSSSEISEEFCKVVCERKNYACDHLKNNTNYKDSAILFIQMQLCKQTLRQWLHSRNSSVKPLNMRSSFNLFEQVINGVEYIHSNNIVHHDIKPSNIFISDNFQVAQVGDFGLSCLLNHSPEPLNHNANHFVTCPLQQRQVGTKLYAAPEQLQGVCTPKSDIYSLGIILFELVYPFMTEMERIQVIEKLQTGYMAPEFQSSKPEIALIIKKLVHEDPEERPTAKELQILVKNFREMQSANFKLLADKNQIIEELRKEIESRDRIIADLQEKLRLREEAEKPL